MCPAAEPRTARASAAAAEAEAAPPLAVEMEHEMAGDEIAEALDEEAVEVRHTVARVVAALGEEAARQLLVQTWQACYQHPPAPPPPPPPPTSTSTPPRWRSKAVYSPSMVQAAAARPAVSSCGW